ncbi:MAG TPA: beta-ketoacyl-[acyl-carrier-protein] synthase family protein [Gemmataceae bacterium]|nr:beta-ketoacyl-[acyl-carrier-protein] synthase family protein [Gemmataceae bacterium]
MASSTRRAVLTGIGVISPIGLDVPSYWDSLSKGQSGIQTIKAFDPGGLPVRFAGEVKNFDAKNYLDKKDRKSLRMMARTIQLAVAAAQLAVDDSKVDKNQLDPARFGVNFGASLIASELEELGVAAQLSANCQPEVTDLEKWGERGIAAIPPLWMLKYLPNMLACHVSILHNAQGPNNTVTESDVASLLAFGEAFRIIGRDRADFFLVGGGESRINPLSLARGCLFQKLSKRNDAPEKACRPFDRHRDGMVLGEGAGVLVLEELEHAKRRGARIYAEVVGFGAAFDSKKNGSGVARAIGAALKDADIKPDQIDHINAHGNSTPESDQLEARGIRESFAGAQAPPRVLAPKSYLGNLGAGSGTTEIVASLLAFHHGVLPPTLNFEIPDPACPVMVSAGSPTPVTRPYFVKIGFTDWGQCAAIVCRNWD